LGNYIYCIQNRMDMVSELLTSENFTCDRYCGECCKKTLVPLQKEDIAKIKKAGFSETEFIMQDPFIKSRRLLKKDEKGWCVFLKQDKVGRYSCSIYQNRPWACKEYPFFSKDMAIQSCLPQKLYPNVFFSLKK
jgi:Fe-S-cluster containining protein